MNKRTIGTEYETMAARYLCTHDYTILARNYRTPFGEVDLIAQKDGVLVYVEVKYRSSNDYGDPLEAVDRRKQRQICKVANYHYAGYAAGQQFGRTKTQIVFSTSVEQREVPIETKDE